MLSKAIIVVHLKLMNRDFAFSRISILLLIVLVVTGAITARLFYLQILSHGYYEEIAQAEQQGFTKLPARRGEIRVEDFQSGESYTLATNTTLNMIFADPTLITDPNVVANTLAPKLFDLEIEQEIDQQRVDDEWEIALLIENDVLREEAMEKVGLKSEEELFEDFEKNLEQILAQRTRDVILINSEPLDLETQNAIKALNLEGTELTEKGNLYAYPGNISNKVKVAKDLAGVFNTNSDELESILEGKNRFVILKHKLEPAISDEIEEILINDRELEDPQFLGIRLSEEYFRFYPEQELASQILGYVNSAGAGQYGVEGSFDDILRGKDGIFTSQIDAHGNQITVGKSVIEEAEDGADITLTIDRAIQLQVERILAAGVEEYNADSGQAIVVNPETGAILAMANYPTFNPNVYGDVFERVEIELTDEEKEDIYVAGTEDEPKYWHYIQVDPDVRIELFPNEEEEGEWLAFANDVGPAVYKNKTIQEVYEPGSIFKPLAMVAAINSGEVTANTTFVDSGPVEVDFNVISGEYDFAIDTFDGQHYGVQTMTQVLEKSNNVGMVFVARTLGEALFYNYIKDFGLTKRTGLELSDEVTGKVEHFSGWTESELVTKAFGQGISMTPIQLIQAYTALANDGVMVRPYLVKNVEYGDGSMETFEPDVVSQVITEDSSQMITAMMTAVAESYSSLKLDNHFFGGKSGTAQTYKWGKALSGPGTTIGSFVGYGPIEDPQFLVLVKIDHPRTVEWGAATAGPVFKDIISFLYDYYNVPPDKS